MDKGLVRTIAVMVVATVLVVAAAVYLPEDGVGRATSTQAEYVNRYFPRDRVIDIYIEMDPADLADMLANPLSEAYKPADVVIDGVRVATVGVRTKGNSSLSSVARSDSQRYSFKIDFDQYIRAQSLGGLTKLNLNNSFSDPSYMREYLSYQLLAEFGIPTPAVGYANVYINGEPWGLYVTVEGIEEPMLRRYFGNHYGTLYKADSGATLVYSGEGEYTALRRMTSERMGDAEELRAMLTALNSGGDLERYLDVDEILRYFAVNTVLVNMDSYLGSFAHNYYLYEQNGRFMILPWDYNMSLGGFGGTANLRIDAPVQGGSLASRPLLGRLLAVDAYRERYYRYIEEFIHGPFAPERMEAEIRRLTELIAPYVQNDPTAFYGYEAFLSAVDVDVDAAMAGEANAGGPPARSAVASPLPGFGARGDVFGGFGAGGGTNLLSFIVQRVESVKRQLSGDTTAAEVSMGAPFAGPGLNGFPGGFGPVAGMMQRGAVQGGPPASSGGAGNAPGGWAIPQAGRSVPGGSAQEEGAPAGMEPAGDPGRSGPQAQGALARQGSAANQPGFTPFAGGWNPGGAMPAPHPEALSFGGEEAVPAVPDAAASAPGFRRGPGGMQPPDGAWRGPDGRRPAGPGALAEPVTADLTDYLYAIAGGMVLVAGATVWVARRRTQRSI